LQVRAHNENKSRRVLSAHDELNLEADNAKEMRRRLFAASMTMSSINRAIIDRAGQTQYCRDAFGPLTICEPASEAATHLYRAIRVRAGAC